jgi:hypothetical protein
MLAGNTHHSSQQIGIIIIIMKTILIKIQICFDSRPFLSASQSKNKRQRLWQSDDSTSSNPSLVALIICYLYVVF